MRQSGYLASAAIFALENHINDLKNDHIKAKEIESVLKRLDFVKKVEPVSYKGRKSSEPENNRSTLIGSKNA